MLKPLALALALVATADQTVTDAPHNASTSSSDNAAAFQSAINAADGDRVIVPAGTFTIDATSCGGGSCLLPGATNEDLHLHVQEGGVVEVDNGTTEEGFLLGRGATGLIRLDGPGTVRLKSPTDEPFGVAVFALTGGGVGARFELGEGTTAEGFERGVDGVVAEVEIEARATLDCSGAITNAQGRAIDMGTPSTTQSDPASLVIREGVTIVGTVGIDEGHDVRILGTDAEPVTISGTETNYALYRGYTGNSGNGRKSEHFEVRHVVCPSGAFRCFADYVSQDPDVAPARMFDVTSTCDYFGVLGSGTFTRVSHINTTNTAFPAVSSAAGSTVKTRACIFRQPAYAHGASTQQGSWDDEYSVFEGKTIGVYGQHSTTVDVTMLGTELLTTDPDAAGAFAMYLAGTGDVYLDGVEGNGTISIASGYSMMDIRRSRITAKSWKLRGDKLRGGEVEGYVYDLATNSNGWTGAQPIPPDVVVVDLTPAMRASQ